MFEPTRRRFAAIVAVFSTCALFWGFLGNGWHVVDQGRFDRHEQDAVAVLLGRLVKTRQDGLFSAGGLNGWGVHERVGSLNSDGWIGRASADAQYHAYLDGGRFENYRAYLSQPGGQSFFFAIWDRILPLAPSARLSVFYGMTALFTALVLAWVVTWFYLELGGPAAMFALGSLALSSWLTLFARNPFWSMWAFYLPMAGLMLLSRRAASADVSPVWCSAFVFGATLLNCLFNGMQYITTMLLMTPVPIVYYAVRVRADTRSWVKRLAAATLPAALAVLFGVGVLCVQIASLRGSSLSDGVRHVAYSFQKRSYQSPVRVGTVVNMYLTGETFVDLEIRPPWNASAPPHGVTYRLLIVVFLGASIAACLPRKRWAGTARLRENRALTVATWVSILAPLSWYVIFKQHSFVHTHLNYVLWQMPFTVFGFALCARALEAVVGDASSHLR